MNGQSIGFLYMYMGPVLTGFIFFYVLTKKSQAKAFNSAVFCKVEFVHIFGKYIIYVIA